MSMRRMIGFSGVLLVTGALAMALPGCGGGAQDTKPGPTGEVPNPALQDEHKTMNPAAKAK
jgi:hypothetical protein